MSDTRGSQEIIIYSGNNIGDKWRDDLKELCGQELKVDKKNKANLNDDIQRGLVDIATEISEDQRKLIADHYTHYPGHIFNIIQSTCDEFKYKAINYETTSKITYHTDKNGKIWIDAELSGLAIVKSNANDTGKAKLKIPGAIHATFCLGKDGAQLISLVASNHFLSDLVTGKGLHESTSERILDRLLQQAYIYEASAAISEYDIALNKLQNKVGFNSDIVTAANDVRLTISNHETPKIKALTADVNAIIAANVDPTKNKNALYQRAEKRIQQKHTKWGYAMLGISALLILGACAVIAMHSGGLSVIPTAPVIKQQTIVLGMAMIGLCGLTGLISAGTMWYSAKKYNANPHQRLGSLMQSPSLFSREVSGTRTQDEDTLIAGNGPETTL